MSYSVKVLARQIFIYVQAEERCRLLRRLIALIPIRSRRLNTLKIWAWNV